MPQLKLDLNDETSFIEPEKFHQGENNYYNMRNKRHGVAVIINNTDFVWHSQRNGSDRDEYNLTQTFTYLGYRIMVCKNLTSEEILWFFEHLDEKLRESDTHDTNKVANDSFVCCILFHGSDGDAIIGSDSKPVKRKDIETLTGRSAILNSRPKLFFIQACRGDNPGSIPVERVLADGSVPVSADFYFCYATVSGDKAYRGECKGSWFVIELCRILCKHATADSFPDGIQTKLNEAVGTKYRKNNYAIQPTGSSQLYKHVHFFHQ